MNSDKELAFRIGLVEGFLKEAEEDFTLKRWRSCVDNSQLSVENVGKAILTRFGCTPKTHEPEKHLSKLIKMDGFPLAVADKIREILPELLTLGKEEHFMTDYGDEISYLLPWDLYTEQSATTALESARTCYAALNEISTLFSDMDNQ